MRNLFILFFVLITFSCIKHQNDNAASISLSETYWKLYYKNNTSFDFYAKSNLYFKQNNLVDNSRNFDTIPGTWSVNTNKVSINFNNGDKYTGTAITNDSMVGTLSASGNNGVWYATRN